MSDKNINNPRIQSLELSAVHIPLPTESTTNSNDKPIDWGTSNDYPFFILSLYSRSPIHANIINQKAVHIWGDGLLNVSDKKPFRKKVNSDDTFELFINKLILSNLIYSAFAVEINFNMDGTPASYIHVPIERIGLSKQKDKIFYYGGENRDKVTYTYERYNPSVIYPDNKSKIFYYEGYIPSTSQVYPSPDYFQLIKTILTDIEISNFNFNQISNHFSPSTVLSLFKGEVDEDVAKKAESDILGAFTGTSGKKVLIDWNNPDAQPISITPLTSGDWADAYITLSEDVASKIYKGHGITSPALFGDKTEGQLSASSELENAYEIWNNSYLRVKRTELESALSDLFNDKIFFQNKPLFSASLSDDVKKSVLTINEFRAEIGMKPLPDGDRLIGEQSAPAVPEANSFSNHSTCQHFSKELTDEDFEAIQALGDDENAYEIVEGDKFQAQLRFDDEADIAQWILDKEISGLSSADLRKKIKDDLGIEITTAGLKKLISDMGKSGIIQQEVKDGKFIIKNPTPNKKVEAEQREIMTMFKYSLREDVQGEVLLDTSRPFCVKLIQSGKLYSRDSIEQMSAIYGYSIMKNSGGHWNNGYETLNHCRHYFKALSVIKKK